MISLERQQEISKLVRKVDLWKNETLSSNQWQREIEEGVHGHTLTLPTGIGNFTLRIFPQGDQLSENLIFITRIFNDEELETVGIRYDSTDFSHAAVMQFPPGMIINPVRPEAPNYDGYHPENQTYIRLRSRQKEAQIDPLLQVQRVFPRISAAERNLKKSG